MSAQGMSCADFYIDAFRKQIPGKEEKKVEIKSRSFIFVDPTENHNKYYNILVSPGKSVFEVEYGRVDSTPMKRTYPISSYDAKINEKIRKGYREVTSLHSDRVISKSGGDGGFKPLDNAGLQRFLIELMQFANKCISENYSISPDAVTQAMIDEAQKILKNAENAQSVYSFNQRLIALFEVLPRKMKDVNDFMANDISDTESILQREQDILDVMAAKVSTGSVTAAAQKNGNEKTILDAFGLEAKPCSQKELEQIRKKLTSESSCYFKEAWRVQNKKTDKAFEEWCRKENVSDKDIHFYYHGSRNENWWGIATQGLILNPNAVKTGSMFGHGLYFAPRAKKSIGYTTMDGVWVRRGHGHVGNTGYLGVYKVAYKDALHVSSWKSGYGSMTCSDITRLGHDALYAHQNPGFLFNDELIVYRPEQCTLRYLIKLEK